ncbi:MAG: hypothetical protein ABSF26_25670 [Thermoguttaceae bacterium]|jgi:hypothetical protein
MDLFRRIGRVLERIGLTLACWAAAGGYAPAQLPEPPRNQSSLFEYPVAYFFVALGMALGMLILLRPNNRRERDRPAQYVEKNILTKDE